MNTLPENPPREETPPSSLGNRTYIYFSSGVSSLEEKIFGEEFYFIGQGITSNLDNIARSSLCIPCDGTITELIINIRTPELGLGGSVIGEVYISPDGLDWKKTELSAIITESGISVTSLGTGLVSVKRGDLITVRISGANKPVFSKGVSATLTFTD